jgi:hypothetical protein
MAIQSASVSVPEHCIQETKVFLVPQFVLTVLIVGIVSLVRYDGYRTGWTNLEDGTVLTSCCTSPVPHSTNEYHMHTGSDAVWKNIWVISTLDNSNSATLQWPSLSKSTLRLWISANQKNNKKSKAAYPCTMPQLCRKVTDKIFSAA